MLTLVGCSEKYSEEDIIGKTSDEIVSTYGEFDNVIGMIESHEIFRVLGKRRPEFVISYIEQLKRWRNQIAIVL